MFTDPDAVWILFLTKDLPLHSIQSNKSTKMMCLVLMMICPIVQTFCPACQKRGLTLFRTICRRFLKEIVQKNETEDRIEKAKAKIVSVLAQNLYVMCCLTKDQMKNITAFWKAVMVFISPQTASTSKRIRASYNTCLREAERRYDAGLERQCEMFDECAHFSIALDTAQFGQDNFLSCVGRFGFEEKYARNY